MKIHALFVHNQIKEKIMKIRFEIIIVLLIFGATSAFGFEYHEIKSGMTKEELVKLLNIEAYAKKKNLKINTIYILKERISIKYN